jgi:hypothetical protein
VKNTFTATEARYCQTHQHKTVRLTPGSLLLLNVAFDRPQRCATMALFSFLATRVSTLVILNCFRIPRWSTHTVKRDVHWLLYLE